MARPETREIATTRDGRDITRGYVDRLPWLPPTDRMLRRAGGYDAYAELLDDDRVAACFAQRRLAVVSRPWEVEPGGDRPIDREAADLLRETLASIDWDRITDHALYARFFGYAVGEVIWRVDGGRVRIEDIRFRDPRRFVFAHDGSLRLRTVSNPDGEPLPERKFWVVTVGGWTADDPYGRGLAAAVWWPVWFKRNGARFWATYLEKFAMPTALGRFPEGWDEAKKQMLLDALLAIRRDSGVIVPENAQVELIETSRSGTGDYRSWMAYWDRAITQVILGQTMTTEEGSSRAQAQVHLEVRQDIVAADADLVCQSANRTWVRWLIDYNLPGAAYPRVWRDLSEPEDLEARARRDEILARIGWRLKPEAVREVYGDQYEPASPVTAPDIPAQLAERTEGPSYDPVGLLADRAEAEAAPALADWLQRIRRIVDGASSLEDLRDRLLAAYGDLPTATLAEVMELAFAVAHLRGRLDVEEGRG